MPSMSRLFLLVAPVAMLGACSTPTIPGDPTVPGKHLVYRDTSGTAIRQFDYPSEDICRRVEAVAGRSARCQPSSLGSTMQAKATLRYNPPGILVEGHYPDLGRCQVDTRTLADGVQLINPCTLK